MRRRIIRPSALALLISVPLPASAQAAAPTVPLTAPSQTGLPEGFAAARTGRGAPGEWKVVDDNTAPGGRTLAQTSTDRTDYRFPLAIYQGLSAANVAVSVRFKAVAGAVDQAAGLVVRLTDPDNYYVVRANALEDNVRFYRVIQGARREIKGMAVKVTPNAWHTIGLRAAGDRFTISYNGADLFTVSDQIITSAGKVALWTKADSVTRFDALTIEKLP